MSQNDMPGDQEKIRLLEESVKRIEEQIRQQEQLMRFHEHRGIDSTRINYPDLFLAPVVLAGKSNGAATTVVLPTDWSLVRNSTGNYTLTHKLGTTNYAFVVVAAQGFSQVTSVAANSVTYEIYNVGASVADLAHNFILVQIAL